MESPFFVKKFGLEVIYYSLIFMPILTLIMYILYANEFISKKFFIISLIVYLVKVLLYSNFIIVYKDRIECKYFLLPFLKPRVVLIEDIGKITISESFGRLSVEATKIYVKNKKRPIEISTCGAYMDLRDMKSLLEDYGIEVSFNS